MTNAPTNQVCQCGYPLIPENNNRCPECGEMWRPAEPVVRISSPLRFLALAMIASALCFFTTYIGVLLLLIPAAIVFCVVIWPMLTPTQRPSAMLPTVVVWGIAANLCIVLTAGSIDFVEPVQGVAMTALVLMLSGAWVSIIAMLAISRAAGVTPPTSRAVSVIGLVAFATTVIGFTLMSAAVEAMLSFLNDDVQERVQFALFILLVSCVLGATLNWAYRPITAARRG